jgi:hypothetical protein
VTDLVDESLVLIDQLYKLRFVSIGSRGNVQIVHRSSVVVQTAKLLHYSNAARGCGSAALQIIVLLIPKGIVSADV